MNKNSTTTRQIITISSNDGWNFISFTLKDCLMVDNQEAILTELNIEGKFWDRGKTIEDAELKKDCEICLPQVILLKTKLIELTQLLENWLVLNKKPDVILTIESSGQSISIFIGPREDFISHSEKPVFSLKYSSPRMNAEWCFVTDQSCINIFLQNLNAELKRIEIP